MQHVRDERFAHPAEPQAGQRDPELRGRQISVQMRDDVASDPAALPALIGEGSNLAVANFDDGKLGRDEETVEEHEKEDGENLQERDLGRDPVGMEDVGGGEPRKAKATAASVRQV